MADIMTPALGESVSEATVARWAKKPGEAVRKDEILVDIGAKSEGVVSNRELYGRNAESQPQLNVGDTVLLTGTVALNKDFGMGYSYDVIVEDADVMVEAAAN